MRALAASVVAIVVFTAVLGFGYPALMTGFAAVAFPNKATGSLVRRGGALVGSRLAAQAFSARGTSTSGRRRRRPPTTPPHDVREPRTDEPGPGEERRGGARRS